MALERSNLFETLSERARWTCKMIDGGFSSRLGILEETITDMNLYEIHRRHSDHILTRKFSKKQEGSKSGADWLWCIGEPGSWFCLLVQAKIISPTTGTCRYLDYKKGEQRSRLQKYALNNRFLPRYCIYSRVHASLTQSLRNDAAFATFAATEWGCALLSPRNVRLLANRGCKTTEHILPLTVPWSCLFSTNFVDGELGLGHHALNSVLAAERTVAQMTEYRRVLKGESARDPVSIHDRSVARGFLRESLPRFVQHAINERSSISSPVAALGILSAVPIKMLQSTRRNLDTTRPTLTTGDRIESLQAEPRPEEFVEGRKTD